jgi:hypothetical protein
MRNDETQSISRAALSPREFAASFGKHSSWAYRLLYSGKINAITEFGRILIPVAELKRVAATAERYNPQPKGEGAREDARET